MIPWLETNDPFPPVSHALRDPNGLLAAGADLSPQRILDAYRQGIFPWFSPGDPILWWSPDPRMALSPDQIRITRSLAKTLRNADYDVRFDTDFPAVMSACATTPRAGQNGTWITPAMQSAYVRLHELGYAHSIETWRGNRLIGGLYGLAIGRAFFGESMFAHATDASKIALAHLCRFLVVHNFGIIDCQMETSHLSSLGATPLPRNAYVARIATLVTAGPAPGKWTAETVSGLFRRLQ